MVCRKFFVSGLLAVSALLCGLDWDAAANQKAAVAKSEIIKSGEHDWLIKHPTILKLVELANQERARNGLPAASIDTKMCLAAQKHAVWMAKNGWFVHSDLPWPEIIHHGPTSPQGAIDGWIYSPAHHGIMLSGTKVGFGYMVIAGQTYWVGVFK